VPSIVAAMAQVVRWRCESLGALDEKAPDLLSPDGRPHPVLDAMFAVEEPRTGTDGTLAWTVDIQNPASGEDFVLGLKEITLRRRTATPRASPARTRCGCRATTRAHWTASPASCRSTCA
jgi:hypothetical protein